MIHSLRLRLLLTMAAVVAVTAGTVALLARQITISEFQRFIQLSDARAQQIGAVFSEATGLAERGEAERQAAVARMAAELGDRVVLADQSGTVIADSAGLLLGRPAGEVPAAGVLLIRLGDVALAPPPGGPLPAEVGIVQVEDRQRSVLIDLMPVPAAVPPDAAAPLADSLLFFTAPISVTAGGGAGFLEVAAAPISVSWDGLEGPDPIRAGFVSGVNRSIGLALVVAGLAALLLTAALSRRIIRPVEDLTAAAQRMATGDLSRRVPVRSRDEIAALGRAFNAMAEGLQRAEELRRHMVSDVAHELRTPLTNIRGYLEAIRDGVAAPDARTIDSLFEEALLLNRLIDDLHDLALADAGQLRLSPAPADLAAVAERAVAVIRPRLEAKGVACRIAAPPDLPPALVDAERIGQVLRNLLNNALTHTLSGGTITIELTPHMEVRSQKSEVGMDECTMQNPIPLFPHPPVPLSPSPSLIVSVRDTGAGIAPEDLPLIFERFYRADRARARATGGAGLGLTIVRRLVEAHGGQAWAESAPGQGATLWFTVPRA